MTQKGENYAYESKKALKKGSYLVLGDYKPTFWSNCSSRDAAECEIFIVEGDSG